MRLYQLILNNVSPQEIAHDVTRAITNSPTEDVVSMISKHVLHSIMDAIGFDYYVTIDEISTNEFEWPLEDTISFRFNYKQDDFTRFQQFLEETCKVLNKKKLLEPLTKIIDTFLKFCDTLEEPWGDNFWEPFSLICYSLLQSMHKIRRGLPEEILVLDTICHKLLEHSQKGLGYPDSHHTIYKGICYMLETGYHHFSYFDENVFKFYSNCMELDIHRTSRRLFVSMKNALTNSNAPANEGIKLVNYLTSSNMIRAYCVFAQQNSKLLKISLLKFLNMLLSYLPVLECFSREQVHTIFSNVFNENEEIRFQALKFYLTFMRKSFTNKLVFRDILDFFLTKADGIDALDCFIASLWDEFPYMTELEPYLKVLQKTDWDLKILSVAAQFTYRVYQRLYEECDNNSEYSSRLSKFLLKLPSLLMLLKDKWQIRGILSNVYSITDPEKAKFTIKDFPIIADRYASYALRYLTRRADEDPAVVQNTVYTMIKVMDNFNMEEDLEEFAGVIYRKYKQLMVSNPTELTQSQVMALQSTLIMLSNITDETSALNEENLVDLISAIGAWLIETNTFEELSIKFGCSLDSLAITSYSGCLNILSIMGEQITPNESNTETTVLLGQATQFLKYLLERLEKSNPTNVEIFFMEAAIRALCDLYIVFNFKLQRNVYHLLVNCVNLYVFEAPPSTDDQLRQLESQRNILHCFTLMHKLVEIPVAITWKIAIHFGMEPQFEKELTGLMDTLFEYNSRQFRKPALFTYVVPVAIYNLFQRQIPLHKFQKALRAHKSYVEAKVTDAATRRTMKIHIVLTMVDMIEKAIKAGELRKQPNRMELLTSMNVLLTDLYQHEATLILNETSRLERHSRSLTPEELQTLSSFQRLLT